tara:strand:+ start:161 stop:433 length:273 start_codon:yes stop_codon:yes gene_type:complete
MKEQLNLPLDDPRDVFELYVKDGNREFVRHVRFLQADSLNNAEDLVAEVLPDYWKTMSIRPVEMKYVWDVYQDLHFSYNICKSMLGLVEF